MAAGQPCQRTELFDDRCRVVSMGIIARVIVAVTRRCNSPGNSRAIKSLSRVPARYLRAALPRVGSPTNQEGPAIVISKRIGKRLEAFTQAGKKILHRDGARKSGRCSHETLSRFVAFIGAVCLAWGLPKYQSHTRLQIIYICTRIYASLDVYATWRHFEGGLSFAQWHRTNVFQDFSFSISMSVDRRV